MQSFLICVGALLSYFHRMFAVRCRICGGMIRGLQIQALGGPPPPNAGRGGIRARIGISSARPGHQRRSRLHLYVTATEAIVKTLLPPPHLVKGGLYFGRQYWPGH